jgi:beta-lactamase class A
MPFLLPALGVYSKESLIIFMQKNLLFLLLLIGAFVVGAIFSLKFFGKQSFNPDAIFQLRLGQEKNKLINPLLACEIPNKKVFSKLQSLRAQLENFVKKSQKNNSAQNISVYFRDLISGQWTGVNEDEKYIPASLVKVPLMMAYYKNAETNPEIFNKMIKYAGPDDLDADQEVIKPPNALELNKEYSVAELLSRMIAYSGNNSHALLDMEINPKLQERVYSDLKIEFPDLYGQGTENSVTARSFATFFRTLYNATYLNREMSQKALELLTQANFTEGLVAGVPADTIIAHKFGERTIHLNSTGEVVLRELHDCGIIYNPNHPYVLCVMTQGKDFENLKKIISEISKMIYQNTKNF